MQNIVTAFASEMSVIFCRYIFVAFNTEELGNDIIRRNHSQLESQPRSWVDTEHRLRAGRIVRFRAYVSGNITDIIPPVSIGLQVWKRLATTTFQLIYELSVNITAMGVQEVSITDYLLLL